MNERPQNGPDAAAANSALTLDDLFCRTAVRQPDATALIDPPNKHRIVGQSPQQLTYAQADRAISALAAQFAEAGLPSGSIVALQLPGTIEFPIAVLAAIRAGMIVALLPQLWRQSELTVALNRVGARALVSIGRIELIDHAELALNAAAEVFSIRHVFGFGKNLPDGMVPLDMQSGNAPDKETFPQLDPRRPAIVTFDVTAEGVCAVPRSHVQLIAGGLAMLLETGAPSGANILSTLAPSSFAGLTSSLLIWLLSGGSLALHHAGDVAALEQQIVTSSHDVLVLPAPLAMLLAKADAFSNTAIGHVVAVWRAPEQMASSAAWPESPASLTDILMFGEIGFVAANRLEEGSPAPINLGIQHAPRAMKHGRAVGELVITPKGKLGMQGVMVPVSSYQRPKDDGGYSEPIAYADTGYGARHNRNANLVEITSPPGSMVAVGGYRFLTPELDEWSKRLGNDAMLAALPDQLNGHRLAGRASDARRVREVLGELGLNPLMVGAFRNRDIA